MSSLSLSNSHEQRLEERSVAKDALYNTIHRVEPHVHAVFDVYNFKSSVFRRYMKRHGL